jgi:hypothetical protein
MVIPGYDPEDIDDILETHIGEDQLGTYLSDDELASYRDGDETLVNMLTTDEIRQLLEGADAPVEVPE